MTRRRQHKIPRLCLSLRCNRWSFLSTTSKMRHSTGIAVPYAICHVPSWPRSLPDLVGMVGRCRIAVTCPWVASKSPSACAIKPEPDSPSNAINILTPISSQGKQLVALDPMTGRAINEARDMMGHPLASRHRHVSPRLQMRNLPPPLLRSRTILPLHNHTLGAASSLLVSIIDVERLRGAVSARSAAAAS